MGNCLERSRGAVVDDAVHCAAATKKRAAQLVEEEEAEEEEMLNKGERPPAVTEVKIRITRKQLEGLLRGLEAAGNDGGGGAAISELLCKTSSCNFRHRPPQWSPSLQSIPE
ncbi:hypothetical protein ABZP36_002536 [Zizania latifolia]